MEGEIPVSMTNDKITIASHTVSCEDLSMYLIYPNPQCKERYVGIFSGNINQNIFNLMDIKSDEYFRLLNLYGEKKAYFDISCFGWFDYKIWDKYGNTLYSGYFDDNQIN